jgi:hypothetical protein
VVKISGFTNSIQKKLTTIPPPGGATYSKE